jgi:outer membrane protein OmpA-like peptidoglycan-associated protein
MVQCLNIQSKFYTMRTIQKFAWILVMGSFMATGCKSLNKTQKGVGIGAAGGAVVGGVIGRAAGNTAMGAIIGAAVGGTAGGVIGRRMDKQAEEMKRVMGDAEVRREGEGIVINFKEKVLFGFNQSDLGASAKGNLDKLVNVLNKYPDTNIQVIGHTDDKGTDTYNQQLSERRAQATVGYLRNQGVNSGRLLAKGMGESDPVVPNTSDDSRSQNRRVEFVITANQQMVQDAQKEAGK